MGLIDDTIAAAEAEAADDDPDDADRPGVDRPEDLFLTPFDRERIKLDDATADRLLGLAVVISNILG